MKQVVAVFFMFCAIETVAQTNLQLTLDDCLELALSGNRQLELKGLELEYQRQQLSTNKRFFVPEINAYARYFQYLDDKPVYIFPQNVNSDLSGPVQLGRAQNFYSGISLNQHLFDVRMLNGRKLTNYLDELSEKRQQMSEEEIRYEVFMGILDGLKIEDRPYLYHVSHTKCAIWTKRKIDISMVPLRMAA